MSAVAFVAAAGSLRSAALDRMHAERRIVEFRNALAKPDPSLDLHNQDNGADFSARLPQAPDAGRLLHELDRSTATSGLVVTSIQVRRREGSREQLAQLEIATAARGSYAGFKQLMNDASSRFANLTISRVSIRRIDADAVEGQAMFTLWGTPGVEADGVRR